MSFKSALDSLEDKDKKPSAVSSTDPHANITLDSRINFDSINDVLKRVFHHESFRTELQRDAIVEACKYERDLFVSLPTGSGKSLIYQLPAVYKNYGLTIVVSPLVALISNQITNAKRLGIPCATINSHMSKTWNAQVRAEITNKNSKLRLLYITPETLCSDHFQPILSIMNRNKTLKLFAIDEAHCVSSWGHEFRPDYLKLGQLRFKYPNVPIIALTATATSKVLNDILKVLNLKEPKHILASPFRANLFYDVIAEKSAEKLLEDLAKFMKNCLNTQPTTNKDSGGKKRSSKSTNSKIPAKKIMTSSVCAGSGSQFVSAATLLLSSQSTKSTSSLGHNSKSSARAKTNSNSKSQQPQILVNETAKITNFFKASPIEVIDLCESDSKEDEDVKVLQVKPSSSIVDTKPTSVVTSNGKFTTASKLIKEDNNSNYISNSSKSTQNSHVKSSGVGIVYCRTKLTCEDVAEYLVKKGIPAKPYHSGLSAKQRTEIENLWMDEEVLVICATISFGMGIDKPNVRVVVHYNMSQSLANYYQESGRAGRDGKKAYCRLYYSQADQGAITFLIRKDMEMEESSIEKLGSEVCKRKRETARAALERFEKMVDYCKSLKKCRHYILAKEFALDHNGTNNLLADGCGNSCDCCVLNRELKGLQRKR